MIATAAYHVFHTFSASTDARHRDCRMIYLRTRDSCIAALAKRTLTHGVLANIVKPRQSDISCGSAAGGPCVQICEPLSRSKLSHIEHKPFRANRLLDAAGLTS
jgi:hypothetical protein